MHSISHLSIMITELVNVLDDAEKVIEYYHKEYSKLLRLRQELHELDQKLRSRSVSPQNIKK